MTEPTLHDLAALLERTRKDGPALVGLQVSGDIAAGVLSRDARFNAAFSPMSPSDRADLWLGVMRAYQPILTALLATILGQSQTAVEGEVGRPEPLPPKRCQCGCSSFARMDESAPGGGFRKGRQFRCVQCKREHDERHTGSEPSGAGEL